MQGEKGRGLCLRIRPWKPLHSIHLPKKIDPEKVRAEFKNGMLTLKAPVATEARAKKVAIEAA